MERGRLRPKRKRDDIVNKTRRLTRIGRYDRVPWLGSESMEKPGAKGFMFTLPQKLDISLIHGLPTTGGQ